MMQELKEKFDYVIIDSAPIGPVTDSQLLAGYANTTIYVVRHALTPKVFLRMIDDLYQQKKFNNMAIVFNGLRQRGFSFLSYGYGYASYGYGYGYGYGSDGYGYYTQDDHDDSWKNLWGVRRKVRGMFKK